MTILVIAILGILVVGFAYAADQWHKRADFWEKAYLEKAVNLEALLDGVEEYVSDGVVRVLPRRRDEQQVLH